MPPSPNPPVDRSKAPMRALMFGNFVVATGVMVVPGMLDRLARDLAISVPTAGHLLSLAAVALCLGAPLFAAFTSRIDRRRLLTASLLAVAVGHIACALAPNHAVLSILRPLAVLGAAQYRGWSLTRANESRNNPRSVRDNPGAYRSSYYIPGRTLRGK
jgi:predicted MFS family arabinose efflux permease